MADLAAAVVGGMDSDDDWGETWSPEDEGATLQTADIPPSPHDWLSGVGAPRASSAGGAEEGGEMTYTTLYDEDEADADEKATNDWTTAHAMLAQVSVMGRDGGGAETLDGRRSGDVATDRAAMGGGGGGDPRLGGLENPLTPAEQGA